MKTITLDGGIRIGTFRKAPPDIDPFKASEAELRMYGLPSIPREPRHRERYRRLLQKVQRKSTLVEPTFRIRSGAPGGPNRGGILGGPATLASGASSGAIVSAPAGDSIRWMQGDWVVPSVTAPSPGMESFCAFWIGIGGAGCAFQAGVHVSVSGSRPQIFPFWEWITPGNGHILDITNLEVRPGDLLSVVLCTGQGAGSTDGTLYFLNLTNASHTSFAVTGPTLAATTAEWSVGFPFLWGGNASLLGDYGEVFFSQCDAVTDGWSLLNGGSGDNVNLTSDGTANGLVVSEANLITPNIVQCLYLGPLP